MVYVFDAFGYMFFYLIVMASMEADVPHIRSKEVTITRLRLRKCRLNSYLHQIRKHPDGLCEACNKPETITHFLTECSGNKTCSAVLIKFLSIEEFNYVITVVKSHLPGGWATGAAARCVLLQ